MVKNEESFSGMSRNEMNGNEKKQGKNTTRGFT
jgi:hypothetical protein